jgi:hypothetical protein
MTEEMLQCSKCKEIKAKAGFGVRKNRPRGYQSQCKDCKNSLPRLNRKPNTIGEKDCTECGEQRHITGFFVSRVSPDGRDSKCKRCRHKKRMVRLNTKPEARITENLRRRTRAVLEGTNKSAPTLALIGCSPIELKDHLESLFTVGMSWDNYGKWHIDHIVPCDSFDLTVASEQRKCFNYKNLQPLWANDNLRKGSKICEP